MRILFAVHQFFPEFSSGTELFTYNIAKMTQHLGHTVKILTYTFLRQDQTSDAIEMNAYTYEGLPVVSLNNPNHANISYAFDNDLESHIEQVLSDFKPDLLHVTHAMRIGEVMNSAQALNIPYVMTLTDFFTICPMVVLQKLFDPRILCPGPYNILDCNECCGEIIRPTPAERLADGLKYLHGAKKLFCPSNFVKTMYTNLDNNLNNIEVCPHGIDGSSFIPNLKQYKAGDSITFAYLGTLLPHKGVHIAIDGAKKVKGAFTLKYFGHSPDKDFQKQLEKAAKNHSNICYGGLIKKEEMPEIYTKVDALIIPSLCYETYSFVLTEALYCNIPVIVSDLGALGERVRATKSGFIFTPGNADELAGILQSIVDHPEILNTYKANGLSVPIPTIEQEGYYYQNMYRSVITS